ncbi:MmgE/PrpD family protein [Microcella sp.]|uniref:MmgE/PrpD family protein n=1 Tax=Microcella sp. TaxID=1913979 RepID=UPI00256111FF|nr:MmgE/PrpD family protein [Microcella sp.]MBX9472357.1 MmgE/PrpD family protein [Microcella sp.]
MARIQSAADVADIVEEIRWQGLSPATKDATVRSTLHVLGTTFLGLDRDISQRVMAYARHSAPGKATMIASGATIAPGDAAMANATVCHADFRDDAHVDSQSHPGVTVIPAALAAFEMLGEPLPAGRFGEAVVAGYQVIGRLGRLGANSSTPRGFRASAIYTVFGAAVAAAKILGLDRAQLESAITLSTHLAAGLNQPYLDGTDDWILLPGFAAKNGLLASLLAREGIVGAPRLLEGEIGFYRAYGGVDLAAIVDPDEPDWEIETTRLKTVLTCGWNQAAANALLQAGVDFSSVDTIDISVSPEAFAFPGVHNQGPYGTYTAAVLSMEFGVGSLLHDGRLDVTSYRDLANPARVDAAHRVNLSASPANRAYDTVIDVHHRNGSVQSLTSTGTEARWLLTVPEVIESLRGKFAVSGLDPAIIDELVNVIPPALEGTDLSSILEILGRPL